MMKKLLLVSLILISTLSFSKNPVNAFKDLKSGKKDEALKSFLEISKKDSTSIIANYALALLYSDSKFNQYDLELSYKYSQKATKYIYLDKWNNQATKPELKNIEKIQIKPNAIVSLKDSIDNAIFYNVKKVKTIISFKQFIDNHPDSKQLKKAKEYIVILALNSAVEINTLAAYRQFINDYPNYYDLKFVYELIETLAFKDAITKNTIVDYDFFIKNYPNSIKVNDAKHKIEELALNDANNTHTFEAYNKFINIYTNSKFIEEAKRKREDLTHIDKIYTKSEINSYKNNGLKGIAQMVSFLNDKFDILTETQKDSVYVTFLKTYYEIIEEANKESSMDYSIIEEIKKLDNGSDLRDEQIKKANNEISDYGVELQVYTMNEDCYYIAKDNYVYNLFKGKISRAMDDYLERQKWFCEKTNDGSGGMHLYFSKEEAYENYTLYENLINKYPKFFLISEVKASYSEWLDNFLYGFQYDRPFNDETHILKADRKSFLEKIIKKNDSRKSTIKISRYYNELKRNNFKDPEWNANNASENNFSDANVEKKAKYILNKSFTKYTGYAEDNDNLYIIEISHAEIDEANSQDKLILSGKMSHYIKYKNSNNTPMGQIISMATRNEQIVASEKVTFYCSKSELAKEWSVLHCEGFFNYTSIKINIDWSSLTMHNRLIVSGKDYALKLKN